MATITKGAAGLVLTTGANWVGGLAPGAADVARWASTSGPATGNMTGSLTVLGLQIDGALGDPTHTSGTLTLTQTDAFVNAVQSNRAWIANGGVIALGASARNFKLNRTGGAAVIIAGAAGLTGTNTLTLSNTSGLADYNYAIFAANGAQAGFTGSIVLLDYTALANWTSAAAATLTACNVTIDGVGCLIGTYINGATIGAAGKTLTINNNMLLGGGGSAITIAYAVALGSVTRTLTVNSNITMSGTVTGTAGVTATIQNSTGRVGGAGSQFLYLTGSSSGLTGACTVSGGRFVVGPSTTAARYAPTSINVASDASFEYFPMSSTDFTFPCAPTGTGFIVILGNHTAGGGITFSAGQLASFGGIVRSGGSTDSGFQAPRIRLNELPGGLDWFANPNANSAMTCEFTYTGGAATYATNLTLDNYSNTSVAGLNAGTYSLIVPNTAGAIVITGTVQRLNTAGTASGRMSLTLGGTNTGDNTLSGDISEVGTNSAILGITKVDAGRWVLSGANSSHTGAHVISAGTLAANSAKALGSATSTGGVAISGTGVLELGDGVTLDKSVTDFTLSNATNPIQTAGTSTLQTKAVTLSVTPTFTVSSGNKLTIAPQGAGIIGGSGTGITKAGAGELELTATANTFTGAVTVSAGTLTVGSVANGAAAAAWGQASSAVAVSGTLKYNGATGSSSRAVQMTGGAPALNVSGSGALTLSNVTQDTTAKTMTLRGTNTDANTISSAIANNTGAVSLAKEDAGKWVLSGALSYTGTTAVNGGTLRVQTANSNTTSGTVTIGASGTVELVTDTLASTSASSGEVLGTGNVTVSGGVVKTRGGTTQKGQVRYGGNLTFGAGSTLYIGAAA